MVSTSSIDINQTKQLILNQARSIASVFMSARSGKFDKDNDQWSNLSLRVRVTEDGTLVIEWRYRFWFTNYKTNKKSMRANYIKKGKGFSYNKRILLNYCKEWEKDEVIRTEELLSKLREAWDICKNIEKENKRLYNILKEYQLPVDKIFTDSIEL